MPMPVSLTSKRKRTDASSRASTATPMTTSPRSVNLTALLPRFSSTCPRRDGSPTSASGSSGGSTKSSSSPFSSAFSPIRLARLSITSDRLNGIASMSSLPASIFEKSRMSLMIPSSDSAEACTFWM